METSQYEYTIRFCALVGNQVPRYSGWKQAESQVFIASAQQVGNQVPRYSGWKPHLGDLRSPEGTVGNQVPRYSGWKLDP